MECNHCTYARFLNEAKSKKWKLTVVSADWGLRGVHVYMHPQNVDGKLIKDGSKEHKKYFVCWFMSLPDHCCC